MVIDTSAILAILFDEPERHAFSRLVAADPVRLLSAANRVEVAIVVEARKGAAGRTALERFLAVAEIEIAPLTAGQAELACEGFRRYGRGRHPGGSQSRRRFRLRPGQGDRRASPVQGRRFRTDRRRPGRLRRQAALSEAAWPPVSRFRKKTGDWREPIALPCLYRP